MTTGIIDVVEWQSVIDLATGRTIRAAGPLVTLAEEIQRDFRYPGDQNAASCEWVTDVGLAFCNRYRPGFIFLTYASPYFFQIFGKKGEETTGEIIQSAFGSVSRFVEESGYNPVILGTGGTVPLRGTIDLSGLDGLENVAGPVPAYAAVTSPSERDFARLRDDPRIHVIMTGEEYTDLHSPCDTQIPRIPDLILGAEEGYIFRGFGSMARPISSVPAHESVLPVHSEIGPIPAITGIKQAILQRLHDGEKIALIVVEGVGKAEFPLPYRLCTNRTGSFTYLPGAEQYLAILTGEPIGRQPFPPACDHYREDGEKKPYPFSGYFTSLPENTIGREYGGRSAAVGSRSIFTHVAAGTTIAIECCARNLYNFGTLAAIQENRHGQQRGTER